MKRKGFTLIELLATIVVLAIIALISMPLVLNTIESARIGAAKAGATNYVAILEDELVKSQVLHPEEEIGSGRYDVLEDGRYKIGEEVKTLQVKGELPKEGTICVDDNGIVNKYSVVIGNYVVSNITGKQEAKEGDTALKITCDITKETVKISVKGNANVCEKEKVVEIEYPDIDRVEKQYSFDKETWYTYEGEVVVKENKTIYARVYDGETAGVTSSIIISKADNEKVSNTSPSVKLSSTKPTSVIEANIRQTDNCEIDTNTIEYGISESEDGTYKYGKNKVFEGLKNNTTYYIKTRANDIAGNGVVESVPSKITTGDFEVITLEPDIVNWSSSKNITIIGSTTGAVLEYRVRKYNFTTNSYEVSNWESYKSAVTLNTMATSEYPTTVYARFNDGVNTSREATLSITKIDTTSPTLTLGSINTTTRSITIPFTAIDTESGIKSTECLYGTSESYGLKGTVSNNSCVMNNVKNGTKYYYKIVTTNNSGISVTKIGDSETGSFNGIVLSPSPSGWSTSKTVTITGSTIGAKLEYRVRKYNFSTNNYEIGNWESYNNAITLNNAATNEYPTTVYTRFNDGYNTSNEATLSITTIDITAPTEASFTYTKSTNSIKVVASGTDAESGISTYWFSKDGGKNWTAAQTSNTYTFTGLSSGTYPIMVSVGNGTYPNGGTSSYKNSAATNVILDSLGTCSVGSASPSGWSTSKSVGITKSGNGTLQYRVGNGVWTNYTNALTINWNATSTNPVSVSCRVTDGVNVSSGNTVSVASVDTTSPTSVSFTTSTATNSIKVVASGTDSESGIYGYQFSKDGGTNWTNIQTGNTYTFSGLTSGNYNIKVRAYNNTYGNGGRLYKDSEAKTVPTSPLGTCSVGSASPSGWAQSKTVTATKSGNGTLQYRVVSGTTEKVGWTNYTSAITINWEANTTTPTYVYCRLTDGTNTKAGDNTQTITTIDRTKPAKPTVSLKLGSTSGNSYTSGAWTNQDVWHIVNSSDTASGVSYYQYSHDGTTWWSNDISTLGWGSSYANGKNQLSYRINWGGQWNFYIRAVDAAGNISDNSDVFTVKIDKTSPGCNWSGESTTWTRSSRTISLTCSDTGGSGCLGSTSSNSWAYTSGTHKTEWLTYTVRDVAGNVTTCSKTANVYVDKEGPKLSNLKNDSGGNWTNNSFNVSYSVIESGSGYDHCEYNYDYDRLNSCGGSSWCRDDGNYSNEKFTASFLAERNTKVNFKCYDKLGNASNVISTYIKIDKTAPKADYRFEGSTIIVTCTDYTSWSNAEYGSGTSTSSYLDYDWSYHYFTNMYNGNAIDVSMGSAHSMHLYCYDNVGNSSSKIDIQVPIS